MLGSARRPPTPARGLGAQVGVHTLSSVPSYLGRKGKCYPRTPLSTLLFLAKFCFWVSRQSSASSSSIECRDFASQHVGSDGPSLPIQPRCSFICWRVGLKARFRDKLAVKSIASPRRPYPYVGSFCLLAYNESLEFTRYGERKANEKGTSLKCVDAVFALPYMCVCFLKHCSLYGSSGYFLLKHQR